MVRILGSHCRGPGAVPGRGTEIPQAAWHGQKKKKEREREINITKIILPE